MTTPGPRDFVLEAPIGDESAEDLRLAALAALSQAFTVTPEASAPAARRRTWLDTFDWRLYRAGLMLEFEQARRGGRLLLSRADGTPQAEQLVTGWPPRRPALDLPPGPVRDRIMVLISPRALLPIVRAVSTARVARLLNDDGKTVARLVADHITVTAVAPGLAGAGTTTELPLRLAVTAVRGYPAQARRASTLLAGVPGVSHASQSVFTAALTALGRHPAEYTSGVDAEITASMPASVAVAGCCYACSTPWSRTSTACSATSTPSSCTICASRFAAPVRPSNCSAGCCPRTWPGTTGPSSSGSAT